MDAVTQVEIVKMACAVSVGDAHALVSFWRKISLDYADARVKDVIKAYEDGNHGLLLMIAEHAENTHKMKINETIALSHMQTIEELKQEIFTLKQELGRIRIAL